MQLQQVDAVGLQPFERLVDLAPGALARPLPGLGREEDPVPQPRHRGAEPYLCLAVVPRDVEVVDPRVECLVDRGVGHVLVHPRQSCRAIDQHGTLMS